MTSATTDEVGRLSPGRPIREPGALIRAWRVKRGLSQMRLAHAAGVSPRHLSFVENARSRPSRELIHRLAVALDMPAREENALLELTGYARRLPESDLSHPDVAQVRRVLRFLLDRHEPNSALVLDRHWNIVMSNQAHERAVAFFLDGHDVPPDVRRNLLRLTFHTAAMRPYIVNWDVVAPVILDRAEREAALAPSDVELARLLEEVRSLGAHAGERAHATEADQLLLPIHLRKGEVDLKLFSVLSTIGSAVDVGLQELIVETFFPADAATEECLRRLG